MSERRIDSLIKDWQETVVREITATDNSERVAEYALHMARILAYPDLDIKNTLDKIQEMGKQVLQLLKKSSTPNRPTQIIESINDYLFNELRFKPNTDDYYNPLNSYLNVVIEKKTGIPITMSILYMQIAQTMNFRMYPVSFPAHFLLKHIMDDNNGEIIVDPFNRGRIMDDYSLKALLDRSYPQQNIPVTHAFLEKSTTSEVMIRMLNNLKASYYESQDMSRYEIANEMVLAIDQYNPDAIRDKGIVFLKAGDAEQAIKFLNSYLEVDPEAADADDVLDVIRKLRSGTFKQDT